MNEYNCAGCTGAEGCPGKAAQAACPGVGTHCGACCGGACGRELILTEDEVALLKRFGQVAFLPVVKNCESGEVILPDAEDTGSGGLAAYGLGQKGLISLDMDIPLSNYDYGKYSAGFHCGSAALTGGGQAALEQMDIQGIEE